MPFRRRARAAEAPAAPAPPPVPESCRTAMARAERSRAQYLDIVAAIPGGPLRDRLDELSAHVDAGLDALRRIAVKVATIERVTAAMDTERVTADLKQARRSGAADEVVDALMQRFVATQKLMNDHDALLQRIDVLTVRLDTIVGQAAQIAVTSDNDVALAGLEQQFDDVVGQLDALAAANAELSNGP